MIRKALLPHFLGTSSRLGGHSWVTTSLSCWLALLVCTLFLADTRRLGKDHTISFGMSCAIMCICWRNIEQWERYNGNMISFAFQKMNLLWYCCAQNAVLILPNLLPARAAL
ncbi:hypothetical protein QBC36DRAFT_107614 [Triangularia setosa]|uniref:Uncharacterized protein n=1 Tax=Triangularia setosa TaxID=2587417 RepID=A0AAN6WGM9_9PEZI|nr:hypothetical protein QBC36DRAFT_107614 [Podospora setosa]